MKEMIITATIEEDNEEVEIRKRINRKNEKIESTYEKKVQLPADERLRYVVKNFMDTDEISAKEGRKIMMSEFDFEEDELAGRKGDRLEQLKEFAEGKKKIGVWEEVSSPDLPEVHQYVSEEIGDPVKDVQDILEKNVDSRAEELRDEDEYEKINQKLREEADKQIDTLKDIFSDYDFSESTTVLEPSISVDLIKGLSLDALHVRQRGSRQPIEKMGAARRRKLLLALLEWRIRGLEDAEEEIDELPNIVLLYDEPDTHFDYSAQRRLFNTLQRLSDIPGVQLLVATHSLNLIDRVPPDSIVNLTQETDNQGVIKTETEKLSDWKGIREIAYQLGLRNHVVLNACLLFTEGPTEAYVLPGLYRIFSDGRSLHSIGVELVHESQQGKDYSWALCKHALRNGRRAFLILDEDARSDSEYRTVTQTEIDNFNEEIDDQRIDENENLIFLGDVELEDVFDDDVLVKALIHYGKSCGKESIPSDEVENFVQQARSSDEGLGSYFQDHAGRELQIEFDPYRKPSFGQYIVDAVRDEPDLLPSEIKQAFSDLEDYVNTVS
ncbi:hypothetical protein GGP73_002784 [Salinibacter ruber]|nr:hypothetical protein [Salinibacter ruber]